MLHHYHLLSVHMMIQILWPGTGTVSAKCHSTLTSTWWSAPAVNLGEQIRLVNHVIGVHDLLNVHVSCCTLAVPCSSVVTFELHCAMLPLGVCIKSHTGSICLALQQNSL